MTSPNLSRRQMLERGALFASTALTLPILAGCGGGGAAASVATPQQVGVAPPPPTPPAPAPVTRTDWRPLRVGAGGFVSGLDIADDGTRVCRCDTYGAYIWDKTASEWKLILTSSSLPVGEWGHEIGTQRGVYEIAIAPSDSSRIYMAFNGFIFKSVNRGATFTKTALAKQAMDPNDGFRLFGRRLAVDPANPDVVFFGTAKAGLWTTANGGADWQAVASVPTAATDAGVIVAFDRSSPKAGGRTTVLYASSQGNGVYRSANAGASFTRTTGGPTSHRHMVVGGDGVLWVTELVTPSNVRRYANGTWTAIPGMGSQTWHSIAVDPTDPKRVVVGASGAIISTSNSGTNWTSPMYPNWPANAGRRVATDIPWLAWTNEDSMSNGDMIFDPTATNTLVFAQGIGVWTTNPPVAWGPHDWTSQSKGIEQLVSNVIVVPPGGSPLYFAWDRPVFKLDNPDVFPATHGPSRNHAINMGWSGDYAATNPRFVVGIFNYWGKDESGYSTDGGTTWTKFATVPAEVTAGKISGSIAAASEDNIVWVPSNNANPWVTRDRGATWTKIQIAGVPVTGDTGWGWSYYLGRHIVTADRSAANTFYMYNYLGAAVGVYRSTDSGVTWSRRSTSEVASGSTFNAILSAVPGKAGHLFFTSGNQSGANPANTKFMRSTDGGATWTEVANVLEVYAFGFGKAASGSDYPAIFIAGYVNRVWGLWRSDDNAANWVKIGDYPLGNFDLPKTVAGDMDRFGRVYVGFGASGGAYAELVTVTS